MNEQDFMKNIDEQTKDIPIPDSISPENMKKMLDNHINETKQSNTQTGSSTHTKETSFAQKHNHSIRRFTAAACLVLGLTGGVTAIYLGSNQKNASDSSMEAAYVDEAMTDTDNNAGTEENSEDLVYQTSLQSPSSYDAYYNTLKSAYDEYYDNLASVTSDEAVFYEEAAMAEESASFEESALDSSSASRSVEDFSVNSTSDTASASSDKEFSSTNTQEENVDEADIIKTDGTYIYKVITRYNSDTGYTDYTLSITETDNGNLKALTSLNLLDSSSTDENTYIDFHEFYLYKNYIVLTYTISTLQNDAYTTETNIVLYDISDKENPKEYKTFTQSGWYESSRISDGFLYTISNFSDTNLDTATPYTNYIPSVNGNTINCQDIYYPRDILMETTYVVTSLDLNNPVDFSDTKALPTSGGEIYVSDTSIYFFRTLYDEVTKTEITKIYYDNGTLTPGENATVTGYLYSSFALNEYNGYLRIVATIPANNIGLLRFTETVDVATDEIDISEDTTVKEDVNVLYILDDNMKLTGKISGIAPGETIYSARFMGDIGYFVTFRNTDPLFSVDLSDPENPVILGKLKIPGFSSYLHFYDDGLLLGFGEEIDAVTSDFLGLKLSMFDISNPSDVTEQDKYIIENSQFSEAQYNHKAMMIDSEKNIFGFFYGSMDDETADITYYYATYTYDKENGFIETAKYPVNDESEYELNAVRGLYIGDYFYLATNKTITSYKIGSTESIAQVTLKD